MDIKLIIYYICIAFGAAASCLIGYSLGKKSGFSSHTIKTYISLALVIGIFCALLMGQLQNFIMELTGLPYYPSRLRIFGALLFMPVLFYFPVKILGGDFNKVTDVFAPGTYAMLGISKIGCAVYGCCYGIACTPGVTTQFEEHTVFPVQLLECVLTLIICLALVFFLRSRKAVKGSIYPLSLIIYSVMRFFAEYLRYYPEAEKNLFFGFSFWQMISLISIAAGSLWLTVVLIILKKKNRNAV